ncbi:phosphoribosylanthranilate isomerase [Ottowia sp. GY511]|uniref:N-(5'-phosphoribosyl)anthranilate isomerase n=1 Tax=Ottowia flava TaxID=2675430 RepID=A0ABW4KTS0_9BURK|nr:phosphoribosylanthranilate isomerase [Ottowia sp. GY511]TXK33619.1 phosphoribosylanthranilate isomerase [Ottowia sp. GY511]
MTAPDPHRSPPTFAHRTRIKICGLTREADVDAAVAAGADAVGFVRYPHSPRHVSAARAAQLLARVPPFVTPVLLYVNADTTEIIADCAMLPGATIQFHGDESAIQCADAARAAQRPWMRAARIPVDSERDFDLVKFAHDHAGAQGILLDTLVEGYGGSGKCFDWSRLPPNVPAHLVLSGGLTPANVSDGIAALRGRGRSLAVDVSSGVEAHGPDGKPLKGIKDADKIHRFVAAVRAADAAIEFHP